jgi:acyl dehydratase
MSVALRQAGVGDVVAELAPPPTTPEQLARYAFVSGDSNPLHLDLTFARLAGFDNLVVHGMFGMAQLGRLLTDTVAPEQIQTFSARFCAVVLVGESVSYSATLAARDDTSCVLALEAVTGAGVVAIKGEARVALAPGA